MRVRKYRDEAFSYHLDLVGGHGRPWTIDLISLTASALLVSGFICALVAQVMR
jgi:hypothetical protein